VVWVRSAVTHRTYRPATKASDTPTVDMNMSAKKKGVET
jgi:hypothetical protein